jgi:hypothetical protein
MKNINMAHMTTQAALALSYLSEYLSFSQVDCATERQPSLMVAESGNISEHVAPLTKPEPDITDFYSNLIKER